MGFIFGVPHPVKVIPNERHELGPKVKDNWTLDWFVISSMVVIVICVILILNTYGLKIKIKLPEPEYIASSQAMPMERGKGFILLKEPTAISLEGIPEFQGQTLEIPQKIMECDGKVLFYVDRPGQIYLINLEDARVKVYTPKTFPGGVRLECYKTTNIVVVFREVHQHYVKLGD